MEKLDFVILVLFVLFMVFIIVGFNRQVSKKSKSKLKRYGRTKNE